MSGHSKWANIKHKKGKADALRGKITTKISREITIAVRMGGADPTGNMKLKLALSKAKANNIPKDNIQRAIQKGAGALEGQSFEEITYEGYGPAGVAMMVSCLTDNRNRTAADVRHVFSKHGGNLGASGCVSYMFKQKGIFAVSAETGVSEDDLMMIALDAGAEDIKSSEDGFEIITDPAAYDDVEKDAENGNYNPFLEKSKIEGFEEEVRRLLMMMLAECCREFEKLPILRYGDILRNILYSGVWCRFAAIGQKRREEREKEKKC